MPYRVRVKPGHPTGTFRRSGQVFTAEPVTLDVITDEIAKDPWLIVDRVPVQSADGEQEADGEDEPGRGSKRGRRRP